jgi:hypothetical protein
MVKKRRGIEFHVPFAYSGGRIDSSTFHPSRDLTYSNSNTWCSYSYKLN